MSLLHHLLLCQAPGHQPSGDAFRKSHEIDGSAGGEQTDYQVKIKVLYGGDGTDDPAHITHIGDYEGGPANPIIAEAGGGVWDHGIREIGNVLYEPGDAGREYKAFYTGVKSNAEPERKIGYAYSPDGKNWTKSASNPVITDAAISFEDPYVINVGGTYYLFCERDSDDTIVMFSSADCETWTAVGSETLVIDKGAADTWEDHLVGSPVVWKEGATWYMLYEGMSGPGVGAIGLATSANGANWNKEGTNPVLSVSGKWNGVVVCDDITEIDGTYYLSIHGGFGNAVIPYATTKTGIATSTTLTTWTLPGSVNIYPDLAADPYNAVDHFQFYWDGANNEWVAHYCDSRVSNVGWDGGLTAGIYRGYPRCTGDMFVGLNGQCRTDFGDVRFRQGAVDLDYWIQEKVDSDYAIFWVEIPTIPVAPGSVTIHIYYGDAASTTTEDGAATWIEYEDWEGYAVDAVSPWGLFSLKAPGLEEAKVDNNRAYKGTKSLYLNDDHAVNVNFIIWNYANKLAGGFRFLLAAYEDNDHGAGWGHGFDHYDNVPTKLVSVGSDLDNGVRDYHTAAWQDLFDFVEDAWHVYETCIVIGAGTWDLFYNGLRVLDRPVRAAVARLDYLEFMGSGAAGKFEGNLGVCCVGVYVDPEPTHGAWGDQESVAWPF